MRTIYVIAITCLAGIVVYAATDEPKTGDGTEALGQSSEVSKDDSGEEKPADQNEATDIKRHFGNVLGGGFMGASHYSTGKRLHLMQDLQKMSADKRYWGSVLGRGFITGGKRSDLSDEFDEVYLDTPMDDKRDDGDLFEFPYDAEARMKRSASGDKRYYHYFRGGLVLGKRPSADSSEDYPDVYVPDDIEKRFGSFVLGRGFVLGKRFSGEGDALLDYSESEPDEGLSIDKRYGFLLRGFNFGKRVHNDRPRPFGNVLGGGFTFGKRSYNGEELQEADHSDNAEMDKRMGLMLGRGFVLGKRGQKRLGWLLGRGLKFGKRSNEIGQQEPIYFIDDNGHIYDLRKRSPPKQPVSKRYGFVLGKGFSFGKRSDELTNHEMLDSEDATASNGYYGYDYEPDKRFIGNVLGRGFVFGK